MSPETNLSSVEIRQAVRTAYGEIGKAEVSGGGCESTGCCSPESGAAGNDRSRAIGYSPDEQQQAPEGADLGLGCGNPTAIAAVKPGETILDLGSGGGFDAFLAAGRVGESGRVIGIDMTPEMVSRARQNAAKGGYDNVEFRLGEIEHLPVADASVDAIISNCVINLSPDKSQVFRDAFRVLKPGGRLAVSDMVAVADLPDIVVNDLSAYAGCVAGAVTVPTLEGMLADAGFEEIRITLKDQESGGGGEPTAARQVDRLVVSATIEARRP